MAYGCLSDILRFLVLVLGVLCLALLLVGFWLGAEQVAVWTLTTSPSTELNVNVWGPAPDLHVVVWWQDLARETNTRLGGVNVQARSVASATIVLCLVAVVMETRDPRQGRRRECGPLAPAGGVFIIDSRAYTGGRGIRSAPTLPPGVRFAVSRISSVQRGAHVR